MTEVVTAAPGAAWSTPAPTWSRAPSIVVPTTFCVLEALHRALRRRDVFAPGSARWADPRAKLLDSSAWAKVKDATLTSLDLPDDPDAHLAELAATLDSAYRVVTERLPANTAVSFDAAGDLHWAALSAIPEPASLVEL